MKRNLDQPLTDQDGAAFPDGTTMKTILFGTVTAGLEGDDKLPLSEKSKLYGLAKRIHAGGVVEFDTGELSLLKDRLARTSFTVWVVGQTAEFLDTDYAASVTHALEIAT